MNPINQPYEFFLRKIAPLTKSPHGSMDNTSHPMAACQIPLLLLWFSQGTANKALLTNGGVNKNAAQQQDDMTFLG